MAEETAVGWWVVGGQWRGGTSVAMAFAAGALGFFFAGYAIKLQVDIVLWQMRRCFLRGMDKQKQ